MRYSSPTARFVALMLTIVLAASACSSGDDDTAGDSTDETAAATADGTADTDDEPESEGNEESEGGSALSCADAEEASAWIRGANQAMVQISDAGTDELFGLDYDEILGAIETLRAIQDIDGIFGTMRPGLDNMEADIAAIQEGRYDDKVGEYGVIAMNGVIGEEVCGG